MRSAALLALAACADDGGSGEAAVDDLVLTPLPTVGGVGVLPAVVAPERSPMVVLTPPVNSDGSVAELIGQQVTGNRVLVIGDSIMASTSTRYTGYMCDELVPLGWSVAVEAEPSRFVDFGNLVLDRRLDPERGEAYDWDAAVVHLGSNYGSDQERFEEELRVILYRLAPRPTLLFTVTEYKPSYAEANESIRKVGGGVRERDGARLGAGVEVPGRVERRPSASDRRRPQGARRDGRPGARSGDARRR